MANNQVPYTAIMQALQTVSEVGIAHAAQNKAARQADLEARLHAMEITAAQERSQQQAHVLSQLIAARVHIEDRRFDLVFEAFRATHSLLAEQQTALLAERKELARQKSKISSKELKKLIYLRKRETEISNELDDIRRTSILLQMQVQMFAQENSTTLTLPPLLGY